MATPRRFPDNAPGDWFVDDRCIDCGHCRVVAPRVFGEGDGHAIVRRLPGPDDARRAGMALVSCPVAAIGTDADADLKAATAALPAEELPDVYLCGFASEHTFGATSWLLRRPDGNVLVDVPRPVKPLLDRIAALGGVRWLFLTHRDDVAGHEKVAAIFGAERVMQGADLVPGMEHVLDGDAELAPDLRVIATPGHTRGSACLLWRDVLFTGDHLWGRTAGGWADGGDVTGLGASRSVAWYSWAEQRRSLEKLVGLPFAHVLPGHGRPWHGTVAAKDAALRALISGR